jgi:DNA-binding GntR family transcriptional regulator
MDKIERTAAMAAAALPTKAPGKRYEIVEHVLRTNIASGRLPPGLVLLEGPIAEVLQTSRAPVQRALQTLEADGLIHRFDGRGFLVGPVDNVDSPDRSDIRELGLDIPGDADEALQSRGSWERIYLAIEEQVAACLIFGEYRIIEAEISSHFHVSRTVVRDVLGRLQERGLVRKSQSSRWLAGPLTAESIKEHYELRQLLEPAALRAAAPHLDRDRLMELRARAAAAESRGHIAPMDWERLETDFMEQCILRSPNKLLLDTILQNQLPLKAANRLLGQLGLPSDPASITEYRLVLDLLVGDSIEAACELLRENLNMAARRIIARLKIVAVIPEPQTLAPYLKPA